MTFELRELGSLYAEPSRNGVAPSKRLRGSGYRMVSMGDLFAHPRLSEHEMERVPLRDREVERSFLHVEDLLFARRSLKWDGAGACSIFLGSSESTTFESSLIRVRLARSQASPKYFYYLFRSPTGRRIMETIIEQTAVAGIKASELSRLRVPVPPLMEQEAIASIFQTLDEKIDSNRRLAALLEHVVQTEFHARFVVFADTIETREDVSQVPATRWRSGVLAEIGQPHRDPASWNLPYIGLDRMPRGSTILDDWLIEDAPTGQSTRFEEGDILFGKLRPYFKKVGVAPIAGRCSTEILVLRPSRPELFGVLLGHVSSQRFIDHCVAVSRGTRMPRAEWRDVGQLQIAVPPTDVAAEFTARSLAVYAQIRGLTLESRTLASIRDALLPKLFSGQIRVPDTVDPEEVVGAVAKELVA